MPSFLVRTMHKFLKTVLLALMFAGAMAANASAATRVLKGNVTYSEEVKLPKSARAEISLVDVSLADAASVEIAKTVLEPGKLPFSYRLRYDAKKLKPNMRYALQVRITDGGQLLYTTTMHYAVTGAERRVNVAVSKLGEETGPALWSDWQVQSISGLSKLAGSANLKLSSDGSVSGNGGCNAIRGALSVSGDDGLSFGPIASTRKMCPPELMELENAFVQALGKTQKRKIEASSETLHLLDANGKTLAILKRV